MKLPLIALVPAFFVAGCSAEPGSESDSALAAAGQNLEILQPGDITYQPIDSCKSADPDKIFYVAANSAGLPSPSGSGAYGYQSPCNRWVVDYKLATYSPDWEISGEAWDLPSSSVANGVLPSNAQDCGRFVTYVTFYRKKSTETVFTNLGSAQYKGAWSSGACTKYVSSGTMSYAIAPPSQSGWDTWRIAVGTKLRTSWQETRAVGVQYIPPPK